MLSVSELKSNIDILPAEERNELLLLLASEDRDASSVLNSLMSKLAVSIPELGNMSEASKVKRLLKLFSLMIYEYNHLTYDEFYNNFFLHSASGEFLDEYAKEIGISRNILTKARGKIRVGSSKKEGFPATLPLLFTVSTPATSSMPALEFKAITEATILRSAVAEDYYDESGTVDGVVYWADVPVEIEAVEGGDVYNVAVEEITEILTSVVPFDRIAAVERLTDEVTGETTNESLLMTSGGLDRESDSSLRARILERRSADFLLSDNYFITKTKEVFKTIEDMAVIRTPEGFGTIGLVVDTDDDDFIDEISSYWNNQSLNLLGFIVLVYKAEHINLELNINLYHLNPSLLDVGPFMDIAFNYVDRLKIGEPFVKEYFEKELVSAAIDKEVKYFKTVSPVSDIVKAGKNAKITLDRGRTVFTCLEYRDE